jgi:hypothetical protein
MILKVKDNPAPEINRSDLTGQTPTQRSTIMVAFRRKRKRTTRKNSKGRARKSARRVSARRRKNPAKKRKTARRRVKSTVGTHRPRLTFSGGKWYGGKSSRSLIRRGSGTRINRRRKRRGRRVRRNPLSVRGIKSMFSRNILMSTAKAGAGIAIGFTAMPILYKVLPAALKDQRRWLGGVHVMLGLSIAGFIRNKTAKDIGLVIAATGVYDLIAMNFDFLGLPTLRTSSELADRMFPPTPSTAAIAAPEEGAAGGYFGSYGSSYPVMAAPVSRVAARGIGASFERMSGSYPSLAYPTVGLSGDDNGCEMGLDDMIN